MNKRCINPQSIQVKELSDELGLKPIIVAAKIAVWQDKNNTYDFPSANNLVEGNSKQKESLGDFIKELNKLPKAIVDSIKLVEDVPIDIIGNNTIYYAMKDVFESNGITDPLLINWAGLHKHIIGHPKNIKHERELRLLVLQSLNKKLDKRKYKEEFKINKLAEESFDNWVKALEDFPLEFQDIMLAHAIKHIINPERKSKYVLQLSSVALTNTYGIMMNKPNEMNRLGKLYDQEVIKSTSDAVEHEKSASGKGYWVHIPKSISGSDMYDTNIELLRKLSPSTWCTSGSLTSYYVENYDNYLLIIDGVTVVGIEAGELGTNGKIQVKEVTSRNNNGTASINHLDDTISFFEKHNLDLNNRTITSAINAKGNNKSDEDMEQDMDFYDLEFDIDERWGEEMREIDRFNEEYTDDPNWDYEERMANDYMESHNIMSNIKNKDEITDNIRFHLYSAFNVLSEDLKNDLDIATRAIQGNPDNIVHINRNNENYKELALIAMNKDYRTYDYLSPEMKNDEEIKQIYDRNTNLNGIDLPFSKSNNLIQGYYNPKTDEVVVVTANTPIKEVAKVAIHEVAHRGMLRMAKDLGGFEELYNVLISAEKQLMEKVPNLLKRTGHKSLESLLLDYGFNKNTKEGKFKLLQELAARWAETLVDKPKPSWWKEFLQEIGKWIKRFTNKTLNEQEVNELVGGFVKYGTKKILNSNDQTSQNKTEITIGNKIYQKGTYSFKEIFENIGDKNFANKLLKTLYALTNQNIDNMKVEIVDNITEAGHFDNNIVRININSTNPDTVFTHEVIHALTALKLAYWKKNSPKVYESMSKIWIDSKAILDPSNTRYEFSSIDEFYAALSKQSFVEELTKIEDNPIKNTNIPTEIRNLLDKFEGLYLTGSSILNIKRKADDFDFIYTGKDSEILDWLKEQGIKYDKSNIDISFVYQNHKVSIALNQETINFLNKIGVKLEDYLENDKLLVNLTVKYKEVFNRPKDIADLKELEGLKKGSFVQRLIQLFKDMLSKLGIKVEGTLAEKALNNLSEIVQTNLNESINGKVSNLSSQQKGNIDYLKEIEPSYSKGSYDEIQEFIGSIHPESKVKSIVFHGDTNANKIFDKNKGISGVFYFSVKPTSTFGKYIYPSILNINNPEFVPSSASMDNIDRSNVKEIQNRGIDSYIGSSRLENIQNNENFDELQDKITKEGFNINDTVEIVVFEPEQITILNSKEILEKWNKFLEEKRNKEGQIYLDKLNSENRYSVKDYNKGLQEVARLVKLHGNVYKLVKVNAKTPYYIIQKIDFEKKYFTNGKTNSNDVLEKIAKSNSPFAKLAAKLISLNLPNVETLLVDKSEINAIGQYNPADNKIRIANTEFKNNQAEKVLIHEILHAHSVFIIHSDNEKSKQLQELYEYVQKFPVTDKYAIKNIDEFMVAIFTNGSFIEDLKKIPSKEGLETRTLWNDILDFFANLFNVENNTAFQQAFNIGSAIIEEQSDMNNAYNLPMSLEFGEEGSNENKGKLSKENVQVGDLLINKDIALRVKSLNENDLTTEDGQTVSYAADFTVFRIANDEVISENPDTSDLEMEDNFLEEEEEIIELNPTKVNLSKEALTFWQKIVKAFDEESDKLKPASTSQSGKLLYNDNTSSANSFSKLNKDLNTPLQQAIVQAATISLYVNKLKYNLLDKKGEMQDKDAHTEIVNNSLLSLAEFIKNAYEGDTSDWSNEKHKKFTQIAEYIRSYIISHQPIMGEMKSILKQSKNQKNEIEEYLRSIGKVEANLNNTFQDMQEVIDSMEEIQLLLEGSNHFATYLITNNKTQVSKSIVAENKKIGRENELINLKVEQLKLKIDATENEEQKISLQAQIDKELAKIKELKSDDLVLDINKELKDGNDTGILTAIFGAIGDFGDKSLTLLRNRVEDAFQELKEKLIPIGKNMQNAWENFSADKNISLNDNKVFEKFVEKVNYIDLDGNERSELHFVSERNMEEYYKEYHEVDNKVKELYNKIADLQSTYKKDAVEFDDVQKEEEFNAEIRKQVKSLYSEIGKIQDAFTAKLTWKFAAINTFTNESGEIEDFPEAEQGIDKHLMRVYNAFIATAGEKDGFWHFKNYMQDNFQLKRMKYNSIYKSKTMDEYLKAVIATKFKQGDSLITMHKKYSSRILVPQKSKYPSNKLEKLSDDEKKLFDVITGIYYKSQENIPEFMRPGTRVPSISKGLMQRVMNDEFSFSKLMQEEFGDYFSDEVSENPNKSIPIYYTNNRMKAEDISQNFVSTVLLFTKQAMAYKTKAQTLSAAKEMQNAIGKTKQKDLNGNQIFNKALAKLGIKEALPIGSDWRNWFLDSWIDQVFYGKTNGAINVKLGSKVVRVDKILQKLMSFSAFGTLGGVKVVNHLTNISMANISNLLESTGYFKESEVQPLFTKSQYAKTLAGDVWKSLRDMLLDSANNKEFGSSVYAQLIEEFEPIQGEFFDRFGNAINSGKMNSKKLQDIWFAPLHLGDLQPQLCAFIAMMSNIPVKLIEGGETNLWDALTVSDDLNENWKTIENWRTVKQELVDKKRKLDELNKKLHGNYNSVANIDRPLARQTVLGQMFEMYRKFIVPGMLLRYGEQRYDINRDEMVEGRYRTLFNYLINDMKWLLKAENKITPLDILFPNENNIEKIRKYYSDEQIVNIRKAVVEQMFITLTSILAVLLYSLSKGGDDDDYILLTTASVVLRVSRDFTFFSPIAIDSPFDEEGNLSIPITTNIPDILRIGKAPFASYRTIENIQDMVTMISSNPTELYKTGDHKGESKLKVKTKKLLGISYGTSPSDILSLLYERTN